MVSDAAQVLVPTAFLLGAYLLCLVVHEAGHLVVAWLVGWEPVTVYLGHGQQLRVFRLRGVEVVFGAMFTSGAVLALARSRSWYKVKDFLISAGGPIASALLLGFLYAVAYSPENYHVPRMLWTPLMMLLILEGWMLLLTLWPRMVKVGGHECPNDGLHILRTLFSGRRALDRHFAGHLAARAERLLEQQRPEEARELIHRAAEYHVETAYERAISEIQLLASNSLHEEAGQVWDDFERAAPEDQAGAVDCLDGLACVPLMLSLPELLPRALRAIERALEMEPARLTLHGTKGSLLIVMDRIEEGERLLQEVLATSESEYDQAICACYLALAQRKRGSRAEAGRMLREAKGRYKLWGQITERAEKAILAPEVPVPK